MLHGTQYSTMKKSYLFLALAVVFVIIQFFPIDKNNPPADAAKDFLAVNNAPAEVVKLFHTACYDCHAHTTVYPWYTSVAPVSWFIGNHIAEGRQHTNYSLWTEYNAEQKERKLEETIKVIADKEMPMLTYWMIHWEAKISPEERKTMTDWLETL